MMNTLGMNYLGIFEMNEQLSSENLLITNQASEFTSVVFSSTVIFRNGIWVTNEHFQKL